MSIASVLWHRKYDLATDPHIALLLRSFHLVRPLEHCSMLQWDLHMALSALLGPPFTISDSRIELQWRTLKMLFYWLSPRQGEDLPPHTVSSSQCIFVVPVAPGGQISGQESVVVTGSRIYHHIGHYSPGPRRTGEDVMSSPAGGFVSVGYGLSGTISTLGWRHRRYITGTRESLVSASSEGGLWESWSGHWACYSSWGLSRFCILGLPEPDTPRAYYICSLLEVTMGFSTTLPTRLGLDLGRYDYAGSDCGCTGWGSFPDWLVSTCLDFPHLSCNI